MWRADGSALFTWFGSKKKEMRNTRFLSPPCGCSCPPTSPKLENYAATSRGPNNTTIQQLPCQHVLSGLVFTTQIMNAETLQWSGLSILVIWAYSSRVVMLQEAKHTYIHISLRFPEINFHSRVGEYEKSDLISNLLGSDRRDEIADTSGLNELPP